MPIALFTRFCPLTHLQGIEQEPITVGGTVSRNAVDDYTGLRLHLRLDGNPRLNIQHAPLQKQFGVLVVDGSRLELHSCTVQNYKDVRFVDAGGPRPSHMY